MRSRKIPLRIAFLILCQALFLYGGESLSEIKVMVLDPGHFHAALVQKEMYPELSKRVYVYAPVGGDVLDYLNRVTAFNLRKKDPTNWEIELHASPDFLERMLRERPGNIVILAGRNLPKIDRIKASIDAGLPVLADKPWIIRPADFQKLSNVLDEAEQKKVAAYDIMTERYEVTSILQRELVNDTAVFGNLLPGTEAQPAISARSVHNLMKVVAGIPIRRPSGFSMLMNTAKGSPTWGRTWSTWSNGRRSPTKRWITGRMFRCLPGSTGLRSFQKLSFSASPAKKIFRRNWPDM